MPLNTTIRAALAAATALSVPPAHAGPPAGDAPAAMAGGRGAAGGGGGAAPAAGGAASAALEAQFRDPPASARPRVWWHWMNGNITRDGIAKDIAWMKAVGIGGLQTFDANLMTPQIVEHRLIYMTPAWKDAFRFAATEADRQGLELGIASSPGWSETGGPWVGPEDGLKKLVWSATTIAGGRRFTGTLAMPPQVTGPFGTLTPAKGIEEMLGTAKPAPPPQHYGEVKVLAFPVTASPALVPVAAHDGLGVALDPRGLADADLATGVDLGRPAGGGDPLLVLDYGRPVTARTLTLYVPGAALMFVGALYSPRLEASDDGIDWRPVIAADTDAVPATYAFAPVTARYFRVVFLPRKTAGPQMGAPAPGLAMGDDMIAGMAKALTDAPLTVGDLRLSGAPRIDRFEAKAGFSVAQDYFAHPGPDDGARGIASSRVIDLTDRMQPDGTLDWTPPAGLWQVVRFGWSLLGTTNHPATPEATGLEVDKFDAPAVRRYMEHYLGMYRDAAGPDMLGAHGVRALVTDSIEVGAANWTPRMIAQFTRLRGYDPTPWLPALAGVLIGSRAESDAFLYDYRRTLADLIASEHYGTIAAVAHAHGLTVYGEALEDHRPSLGDDMAMRSHTDVPMSAMWTYARADGPKPTYLADTRGAASVAHIYGQNLVAAESMTSSMNPWADSPQTLKRVIDLEFLQGINRPVIHTSVHQPVDDKIPGLSLFIFGQYFNRHESWAPLARPWIDYMARNALLLQQGHDAADVGYFYGEEAPLTGLYGDRPVADAPTTHAWDFVNADALTGALANDGGDLVTPGGARYKALYLGGTSAHMTLDTLARLAALVEGGATIVGMRPAGSPGNRDATPERQARYAALVAKLWPGGSQAQVGRGRVIASRDIEAALAGIGIAPDFAVSGAADGADIGFVHRRLPDGDGYFVVNRKDRAETFAAHFRVTGKIPELWHAETGTTEPVSYRIVGGETIVPLDLGPEAAVHVMFRRAATAMALTVRRPAETVVANLAGRWTVAFEPGRGAPARAILPGLAPLDRNADPAIRYFSGIAAYAHDFAAPKGWRPGQPLWLDLGDVDEMAEVRVNGIMAGSAWHVPFRVDIGAATQPGRNHLEVRVANLWVNRLIGDAQPGAHKITWTALPTYRADAPLRRSGLIGPVRLLAATN